MEVITIEQLSSQIHKTVATIRTDRVRNPERIPPCLKLPTRRLLWDQAAVDAWMSGFSQTQEAAQVQDTVRKPGRPTIASKINTN